MGIEKVIEEARRAYANQKVPFLKVLRAEEAAYGMLLEEATQEIYRAAARANGMSIADVIAKGDAYADREKSFALEDYVIALFTDEKRAGTALNILDQIYPEAENIVNKFVIPAAKAENIAE